MRSDGGSAPIRILKSEIRNRQTAGEVRDLNGCVPLLLGGLLRDYSNFPRHFSNVKLYTITPDTFTGWFPIKVGEKRA